jgi:hypothetical protein
MARNHNRTKRSNDDLLAFAGLDKDPDASRSDLIYMSLEIHETEIEQHNPR